MAMAKYFVDIPTFSSEYWNNVATFDTREEAIKFVQENFGADENGKVCLVTEINMGDDELQHRR